MTRYHYLHVTYGGPPPQQEPRTIKYATKAEALRFKAVCLGYGLHITSCELVSEPANADDLPVDTW